MPLPRTTPEAQGIPSAAVTAFVDALDALDAIHSVMILRHGNIVAEGWWEPYQRDDRHMLFSLSKSFTSTAAGFAIAEGLLSADDLVLDFFPDDAPADPSDYLRAMRVRHLLSMSTGHTTDTLGPCINSEDGDWVKTFLACPVEKEPGTHFLYNSGATYMVSAIVQKLTGQQVVEYLGPRLFEPLGITEPVWETCPKGINTGGWGLSLRTEDIARFGQLYLQDGVWEGQQLLPGGWVAEATRKHVDNSADRQGDWAQGYGYQFWRCRHDCYRGDGAFGQFCVVMPEQDAVLAITSGVGDLQGVLDLAWSHLLPAMGDHALPASSDADELAKRLITLRLDPPQGEPQDDLLGGLYALDENPLGWQAIGFDFVGHEVALTEGDSTRRIAVGLNGQWLRSGDSTTAPTFGGKLRSTVAATAAWDDGVFVLRLFAINTPFGSVMRCRFEGEQVMIEQRQNVAFGGTQTVTLTGQLASS